MNLNLVFYLSLRHYIAALFDEEALPAADAGQGPGGEVAAAENWWAAAGGRHLWCTEQLCTKEALEAEKAGTLPFQKEVAAGTKGPPYARFNATDFSEEMFMRAVWEGPKAVEELEMVGGLHN